MKFETLASTITAKTGRNVPTKIQVTASNGETMTISVSTNVDGEHIREPYLVIGEDEGYAIAELASVFNMKFSEMYEWIENGRFFALSPDGSERVLNTFPVPRDAYFRLATGSVHPLYDIVNATSNQPKKVGK